MKPATPKTELPPSTRLRKVVFGGFHSALLVAVLLVLTGCNTLITGEYINTHPKISALARGMTLERALDIVKMRFDYRIDDSHGLADESSRRLISIDKAGVVYEYSSRYQYQGKLVNWIGYTRTYEVETRSSSGRGRLRFADVAVIKIYPGRPHNQLALRNDKGQEVDNFSVEHISKKDINELIAALYFLCPNMHNG